jgi:hypothetical protein
VVGRDPRLVVGSTTGQGTAGDSRAVSTDNADLLGRVDLLAATRGALGTLTTLAATLLLGEEGGDPGVVDEVDGTGKDTAEDQVEEDAVATGQSVIDQANELRKRCLHLRVEEAGRSLNNRYSAVESRVGVQHSKVVLEDGGQVEGQILRVHVGSEAVGGSLLLAGRDQQVVLGDGQVVDGLGVHEGATDEAKVNGSSLVVGDGQNRVGCVAIDELDTKDFRVREGH